MVYLKLYCLIEVLTSYHFLMKEVCRCLGIEKLNTTAYHPQCDGLTESCNRTLKTMLRKHVDLHGTQWDKFLHGVVWAYRNTPHIINCGETLILIVWERLSNPIEATFLPVTELEKTDVTDYHRELVLTLMRARDLAAQSIQDAQRKYNINTTRETSVWLRSTRLVHGYLFVFLRRSLVDYTSCHDLGMDHTESTDVTSTGITAEGVYTSN